MGLWQARTGLPILLVNIHMVLAVCLVAAMTAVVMHPRASRTSHGLPRDTRTLRALSRVNRVPRS